MTAFDDLAPCDYFGAEWASMLHAVGWIESQAQLRRGAVDSHFFDALTRLLEDPWQPVAVAGHHRCTLCRFSGGPSRLVYGARCVDIGATNLFVFGEKRAYVAPSLVAHYIDAHDYAPPEEFQRAVMESPPMRSMDYLRLVRRQGLHRLGKTT